MSDMPKYTKEDMLKWAEILESGEYKQAKGTLMDANGACCCLGVFVDNFCEGDWHLVEDEWHQALCYSYEGGYKNMPPIAVRVAIEAALGGFEDGTGKLAQMNDEGCSFQEIAQAIRFRTETHPAKRVVARQG